MTSEYRARQQHIFGEIGEGLSVVVDGGNGIAGPLACAVLRDLDSEVHELYTEPDGTFPNHPADPSKHTTLRELQQAVRENKANLGIAFDGDGDRLGIVDENGVIRTADEILLLLARDHLQRNPGKPIVFTVSNSGILETEVKKYGGEPVMCAVGHSCVEHVMREKGSQLGGEQSGHFFCAEEYEPFDDALYAALRVLAIAKAHGKPFSTLFADFPAVFQASERRPHCPDDRKRKIVEAATKFFATQYPVVTLDGVRIDFGDGAWAGIRQSNTSPCLSICIEARTEEKLEEVEEIVLGHMKTYEEIEWGEQ
jgi:phosphomannomutase/phosphoglucomutase